MDWSPGPSVEERLARLEERHLHPHDPGETRAHCVSCGYPLEGRWVSDDGQCTHCVDTKVDVPEQPAEPRESKPGEEVRR